MTGSVGVVGAGAVGRAVVTAITASGVAQDLVLVSRTGRTAAALAIEANDMAAACRSPTRTCAVTGVAELCSADVIVIAARSRFTGTVSGPDQRLGGLQANAPMVVDLAKALGGYDGAVLVVTNPVDIMTRLFAEEAGTVTCYGIGSNLDSARYRLVIADDHGTDVADVAGHVVGEHGATMTLLYSTASVHGQPARIDVRQARSTVLDRSPQINQALGRTAIGPAGAVLSTLRRLLGHENGLEILSARGLRGVFYGQPVEFHDRRPRVTTVPMSTAEQGDLATSRDHLDELYRTVQMELAKSARARSGR